LNYWKCEKKARGFVSRISIGDMTENPGKDDNEVFELVSMIVR
jgi:hypothetical protein